MNLFGIQANALVARCILHNSIVTFTTLFHVSVPESSLQACYNYHCLVLCRRKWGSAVGIKEKWLQKFSVTWPRHQSQAAALGDEKGDRLICGWEDRSGGKSPGSFISVELPRKTAINVTRDGFPLPCSRTAGRHFQRAQRTSWARGDTAMSGGGSSSGSLAAPWA